MRIVFFIIILFHGLVHLLGFIKAFGFKEVKELTLPISKPIGIIWLCAAVLFMIYVFLFLSNSKYSWLAGIVAVVVSQVLIILFWKNAGFGSIPNIIILIVSLVGAGSYLIQREFIIHVKQDFITNNTLKTDILTENDIAHMPMAVQKYLHYTLSVGQPKVKNFRAEFTGGMRSKPEDDYMKFHSVQYNFYNKPSRYFFMEAKKMGLPATGLHIYKNKMASFTVKLLNWMKIIDAKGERLNQAETVTLLNDMCFIAPAALIDSRISWETINDTIVKAVYTNGNIKVSALLYFNDKGELINFISNDRYETDGKNYNNYPWATPVENYRINNGFLLPGKAKLIYLKPDGDFTYGELEFKDIKYNLTTIED